MPYVGLLPYSAGIPAAFFRIDFIEGITDRIIPTDIIEDKELRFGSEKSGIRNTGRFQLCLGALGKGTRITFITLHGIGFEDITAQVDGWIVKEGIKYRCFGVRH